jgi:hypothetical protein
VFDGPTTSDYSFTTTIPEPKFSHKRRTEHAGASADISRELLENFDVESLFGHTRKLKETGTVNIEQDREVSYTLYIAESLETRLPRIKYFDRR